MIRLTMLLLGTGLLAAGAAVGFSVFQEGEAAPAAPPEPVPITEPIESWYKVMQDGEHMGFAHTLIAPNTALGDVDVKYVFKLTQDLEVRLGEGDDEKYLLYAEDMDGAMDGDFRFVRLRSVADRQGVRVETRLWTEGGSRRAEVKFPALQEMAPIQISSEDLNGVHLSLDTLLMKLAQEGVLLKPGLLKAPLLFSKQGDSSGDVQMEEVELVFYGEEERDYLGKPVSVAKVELRGLPIDPKNEELQALSPKTYYLDRYGRIVEKVFQGGLQVVLVENDKMAIGNRRRVLQAGRRDPFAKELVMRRKGEEAAPGDTDREQKTIKQDELPTEVSRLGEVVKALELLLKEGKTEQDLQAKYDEFLKLFVALYELVQKDTGPQSTQMGTELAALKKRADAVYPGPKKVYHEASLVFRRLAKAASTGGKVEEMNKILDELKDFRKRPELIGTVERGALEDNLIEPAIKLIEKSRVREDLRNKKLALEGTTEYTSQIPVSSELGVDLLGQRLAVGRNVIVVYTETLALINGDAYRVGDIVKDEDVRVEEITRFGVKVSLKGEIRELPLQ